MNTTLLSLRRASIALIALAAFGATHRAHAAAPASGSISANTTEAVTWTGSALSGPAANEQTCVDGVNCDVYTLTVNGDAADYEGKIIKIDFNWMLPATDYDFYIHKDKVSSPVVGAGSNGGLGVFDGAAILPTVTGTGVYVIHVVYFSSPGPADQYKAAATIASAPGLGRIANFTNTGITFSPNVTVKTPVAIRDGEPSNRTDFQGNAYVGGIRGLSAGVDLWFFDLNPNSPKYDPLMRVPYYRGQPDAFSQEPGTDFGADGGGDIDLAVGFPPLPPGQLYPTLNFSSLLLANVSTGKSTNRGESFSQNPVGNATGGAPGDDREWQEFLGNSIVYLWYRTAVPAITQVQRSTDGGFTFGPAKSVGITTQVGPIDVHQSDGVVYAGTSQGTVAVGTPKVPKEEPAAEDYKVRQAATDPSGVANLFFVIKIADDGTPNGTLYACYSNGKDILLRSSADKGVTWNDPVRVNDPALGLQVNLFPWMETGPTKGSVGVVWYGTTHGKNDDDAEWKVFYAQSFNADADSPTFSTGEVTEPDHVIHSSNISTGGLTGAANRNLIDYFQVSFDPTGAAVVAYTDDHNDYDGHTYVSRQISGPSINNGEPLPPVKEGTGLVLPPGTTRINESDAFPPRVPGLNGEQVTDYALDVANGMAVRESIPDPEDVLSVRYDTSGTGETLAIAATMRLSDLTVIPGQTSWQMNFAVNAPHSTMSPTGTYSFGSSDDGDQFYVQADTNASGAFSYSYGKAVRASDGKLIYTRIGAADAGLVNKADNTISVQVSVAKLNAALPEGRPPIQNGSVVAGLRGRAFTVEVVPPVSGQASRQGRRDITRGGTQFVVRDSAFPPPAASPNPTPLPPREFAPGATPAPTPPTRQLANIATRVAIQPGEGSAIAGFIKRNSASKRLLVRGIGPSIKAGAEPLAGTLQDPVLEIYSQTGTLLASNDNWRSAQQAAITATGLAPIDDREPAVIVTLTGSAARTDFTAVLKGTNDAAGVGVIEVYDLDAESFADLGNLSTRGFVGVDAGVLIGGLILRDNSFTNGSQTILMRGIGPSLASAGVTNPLADPTMTLVDVQGNVITSNDDWQSSPEAPAMLATGIAPSNPKEAAILRSLAPGAYTVILQGQNGGTGIGLLEAFNLDNQ